MRKAELTERPEGDPAATAAIIGGRQVWYPETREFTETALYARDRLAPGMRFQGPAIVEQMDTTTLVPPGVSARVDRMDNLILEIAQ